MTLFSTLAINRRVKRISGAPVFVNPVTYFGANLLYSLEGGKLATDPLAHKASMADIWTNNPANHDGNEVCALYDQKTAITGDSDEYRSNFSASVDGWSVTPQNVAVSFGVTFQGRNNCLQIEGNTTVGIHEVGRSGWSSVSSIATHKFQIPAGNTVVDGFVFKAGNNIVKLYFTGYTKGEWHDMPVNWYKASGGTSEIHLLSGETTSFNANDESIYFSEIVQELANIALTGSTPRTCFIASLTNMPFWNETRGSYDYDGVDNYHDIDDFAELIRLDAQSLGTVYFSCYDDEGTGNVLELMQIGQSTDQFLKFRLNASDQLEIDKFDATTGVTSVFTGQTVTRSVHSIFIIKTDGSNYTAIQVVGDTQTDLGPPTNDDGDWYADVALPTSDEGYLARNSDGPVYGAMGLTHHSNINIVTSGADDLNTIGWINALIA